jgi:hypothetical protein
VGEPAWEADLGAGAGVAERAAQAAGGAGGLERVELLRYDGGQMGSQMCGQMSGQSMFGAGGRWSRRQVEPAAVDKGSSAVLALYTSIYILVYIY